MGKKLVRSPDEIKALEAILTPLIDVAKERLQQGTDINGRPVTPEDFAIVNRARAERDRRGLG
jgi:hypothetical protein